MAINSEIDRAHAPTSWMQSGFYAASIVFSVCLIGQLLTVGFAYFNNPAWWDIHVWLVRESCVTQSPHNNRRHRSKDFDETYRVASLSVIHLVN